MKIRGWLIVLMLAMTGCGSVFIAIGTAPDFAPPSITFYQFLQDTVNHIIGGNINFFAPDIDLDTMTVTVIDSRGSIVYQKKDVLNLVGVRSGTIPFAVDYSTFPLDTYTLTIFLTDFQGAFSNQVVIAFSVP